MVWSKSEETGEVSAEAVTALHENAVEPIHALTTRSADGEQETIEVTAKHPYWVVGSGWLDSGALKPGMVLLSADGGQVQVVELRPLGKVQTTYNVTVANHESYFVGEQRVWVHNCGETCDAAGNTVPVNAHGVPSDDFSPMPGTGSFNRDPKLGPTQEQKDSVQGQPCVVCGTTANKMVADHKDPLVVEHYRTGSNDVSKQTSVNAVQPHCPSCSSSQGGQMANFSRKMKAKLKANEAL